MTDNWFDNRLFPAILEINSEPSLVVAHGKKKHLLQLWLWNQSGFRLGRSIACWGRLHGAQEAAEVLRIWGLTGLAGSWLWEFEETW